MNKELAISAIKEYADQQNLDRSEQLILTCEFITTLDADEDFKRFLTEKDSQRNKN